jgi:Transposase DDE domain
MASVARTLRRIKEDLEPFVSEESILDSCKEAKHKWRACKLGPVETIHLFLVQVLCFNTAMTHLRHVADAAVKGPAYCKARMRLPLEVLQSLLRKSSQAMRQAVEGAAGEAAHWCGLRALLVDGSSTIAPDTPSSQKEFGQPTGCKPGCGFPVPKVLALFDAFSGLVVEMLAFPLFTHEQSKVATLHPLLGKGDLLVGDRGFCSFAHLAMLSARGVHALFRMHQRQIVDFRPHRKPRGKRAKRDRKGAPTSTFVRRLAKHDQVVQWTRPAQRPKWMAAEQCALLPKTLLVREIRYRVARKGQRTTCVTIATTLLDPALYPKEKIEALYDVRWTAETHLAELKTTLKMRKVKSKTAMGVKKELAAYALVYNLVHAVMAAAALRQGVTPDRISFIDAVRALLSAGPGEALPELIVNPRRPDRHEPRVVKDLQDTYRKMTRPRPELRKALRKPLKTRKVAA